MKKILIICLLYSGICLGQQGINYKAIISDNGVVVQNQQVGISFTILEDGITEIYKELHVLNTDANGLIINNIGEGITTIGDFATLDWSQEYYLNVEVDAGNGTVDMGTTAFKYVPYALHAKTAETFTGTIPNAGNLVKVTENGNEGFRLVEAVADNHGDIGDEAIDLSFQSSVSETKGATERGAFASGYNTEASAEYSVAFGYRTQASDTYATSFGANTMALGYASSTFGDNTKASGYYSTAFGRETLASSYNQTTMGSYNTEISSSSNSFVATDPLFVIGNGTSDSSRSEALIIQKSGDTEINGTLTIDASNDDTGYTLPSEKGDSGQFLAMNETDSGTHWQSGGQLAKITENNKTGYRLADADPNFYGDIGANAVDLSIPENESSSAGATGTSSFASGLKTAASGSYSAAMGYLTKASGYGSTAMGYSTTASGTISTALGTNTIATGYSSTALGNGSIASGEYSTALGNYTTSSGQYSIAIGYSTAASGESSTTTGISTRASGVSSTAMGRYNTAESFGQTSLGMFSTNATGTPDFFVATDRLLVVGNGDAGRSDAMVILKNGNTTINGDLEINGNFKEVNALDSGDADMKAYIYGLVTGSTGVIKSASSDGFTVTRNSTGSYSVVFNNAPSSYQDYMLVSSLHGSIGFIKTVRNTTHIAVNTYNTSGVLTDSDFNFVVYKK